MNSSHIQGFNIETFEPWSLLIVYGQPDQFFVESKTLNKCYNDPYFALREMYYEGLLTEAQHREEMRTKARNIENLKLGKPNRYFKGGDHGQRLRDFWQNRRNKQKGN